MSAPIPSFFKLRLGLVAICFLLFFMFLGFVRDVFAVDCSVYSINVTYYKTSAAALAACSPGASGGTVSVYSMLHECYDVSVGLPYYLKMTSTSAPYTGLGCIYDVNCQDDDADDECDPPNCAEERANLSSVCGGDDQYYIDESTCEGYCLCTDQQAALEQQCGGVGHFVWTDRDNCEGHCVDCLDEAAAQCGSLDYVEWNQDGECSYECKRPCEEKHNQLAWECGSTYSYWIDEGSCAGCCISDTNHDCDKTPDDKDDDDDNDGLKDKDDPCPHNPDPNCSRGPDSDGDGWPDSSDPDADPDGDGYNNDVDDDDDGDGIKDWKDMDHDQDGDGLFDWEDDDDDNDGVKDINDPDADPDGDGKNNEEDDDDDDDGILDIDDVDPSAYQNKENPYSVAEDTLSNQFTTRWTQFVGEIKQTSFFSIPDQVFGGFSSGSQDASISIEGGETFGDHEVSFSNWSSGLAALRAVLYAVFGVISVRIVTLKH